MTSKRRKRCESCGTEFGVIREIGLCNVCATGDSSTFDTEPLCAAPTKIHGPESTIPNPLLDAAKAAIDAYMQPEFGKGADAYEDATAPLLEHIFSHLDRLPEMRKGGGQ